MEDVTFPPSPSWFLPNIMASRKDGTVSYGSKNNIVILKAIEEKRTETVIITVAHSKRVTGVAFSPSDCNSSVKDTIASCSEDGLVKLWKISSQEGIICHKSHMERTNDTVNIVSLDWSLANPNYIISAAENNTLVLWDVITNTTVKFSFQKLGATVVACCPYNEKIVAVGGKTGQIFIINLTESGNIIYRLRGHDNKIQSLTWCPVPYNIFEVNCVKEEFLLASACQDKEIYIWRAGSNGKCEVKFQVPTSSIFKKDQYQGKIGNSFSFTALFWGEPYRLFLSSNFCELLYFDVKSYLQNKSESGGQKGNKQLLNSLKLGHYFHSKGLFAIAGTPRRGDVVTYENIEIKSELKFKIEANNCQIRKEIEKDSEKNFKWDVMMPEGSSLIWTAGQDKKLLACKMGSPQLKLVFKYHTMSGFVFCAAVSPHDPNLIAIGVGDGMIRLWNLTKSDGDVQSYWQKIKDKVLSLAWHPTKDGVLAYGTSEGRVGLVYTSSNKSPSVFKPCHPQPIYNLSWGPRFHTEGTADSDSKSDFDLYSVGDNKIWVYNPLKLGSEPLNLSRMITFPCKKQTDVCWKPDFSLLAVGNDDGSLCLIEPKEFKIVHTLFPYKKFIQSISWHPSATSIDSDLSPYHGYFTSASTDRDCEIRVFNCTTEENGVKVEKVATLKGHHGHIQSVSWSTHIGCRLMSTSVDGSVQIWDVISQSALINFTPAGMPLFSIWSPIDPDIVLTGCRSDVLCLWRVSAQTKTSPTLKEKIKKKDREKTFKVGVSQNVSSKPFETTEVVKENGIESVTMAEEKTARKYKEPKMFSKAWSGDANDELKLCYSLLKEGEEVNELNFSLPFLRDSNSFEEMIKADEESCQKANKWTEFYELSLWNGNIKEVLEERIKNGGLSDFLVSLAPMVSPQMWIEACLSYSKSLVDKKLFRRAASYLMVCHKIYEAIRLLADANLYVEALCIARCRLPKSDPVIKEVVKGYAEWLFKNGAFLKACECYIYLEDYLEVTRICGLKSQAEYLSLAALAAKKCGALDLESMEATNSVLKCFESNNFELARRVCDDHQDLKHLRLLFNVYHTLSQLHTEELVLEKDILHHVRELSTIEDVTFPDSFPQLYHKYEFYTKLRQVYIIIAQELSFAACAKDEEEIITHLIKSLSTCCRYIQSGNEVHPLCKLCAWLPPEWFSVEGNSHLALKLKSMRAFLCAGIVRKLTVNQNEEEILEKVEKLNELKEDLLDEDSYKYFKNLLEVEACENRFMANQSKVARRKLTNGNDFSPKTNGIESSGNESVERHNKEQNDTESNIEDLEKSSEKESEFKTSPENENGLVNGNGNPVESPSKECEGAELEKIELEVGKDLELLKRLKAEIKSFEETRISSPNPVPVYFMLKQLCEKVSENQFAKVLLEDLEKKWQRLN